MKKLLLLPVCVLALLGVHAQIAVNGAGSATQNFDALPNTGTTTWTDNSTLPSWYAQRVTGAVALVASDGSSGTGAVYSFGAPATADRAFGSVASGGTGAVAYGVQFHNTGSTGVQNFSISYTMEQWRNGGNTNAQPLTFWYMKSSSAITLLTPGSNTGWTAVNTLDATTPVTGSTAAALVGNTPANQVVFSNVVIPGLTLNPGEYLMLRWVDVNDAGNDHGLSVDDFSASWATSCATTSTLTVSTCDSYTVPSGDETYTTSGTYFDTIPNAALCDSVITINLTILTPTTSTFAVSACSSYTVPSGDETYSTSGTYMDTIPNAAGCDSIMTINLTIAGSLTFYQDNDGDTYGNPMVTASGCTAPAGYVSNNQDCDDNNSAIGAPTVTYYTDSDGDGYGNPLTGAVLCSGAGMVTNGNDCDDTDNMVGPATTWYPDTDNDGFGAGTPVTACSAPTGHVANNADCDDSNGTVYPGAFEIADNGIDEDCNGTDLTTTLGIYNFNGTVDCATRVVEATSVAPNLTFSDFSADSVTCAAAANVFNNSGWNTGSVVDTTEFAEFTIYPDDCYSLTVFNLSFEHRTSASGGTPTVHVRSSADNFASDLFTATIVNPNVYESASTALSIGGITDSLTFRFYVTNINTSGATYRLENVQVNGYVMPMMPQIYYADTDGDGYGDFNNSIGGCTLPAGYVVDATDCDDTDATINPATIWYEDNDSDGLGNANVALVQCAQPTGYVSNNTDCDDNDNSGQGIVAYYPDTDNDGHGNSSAAPTLSCTPVSGAVTNNDDCNDNDNTIYPGATEICDNEDNDCDGDTDENLTIVTYYLDADNDGFGDAANSITDCVMPTGYVLDSTDCNDQNMSMYPGAPDQSGNGMDENCDGVDGVLALTEQDLTFSVYPNPGMEFVTIALNATGTLKIAVVSPEGKTVLSETHEISTGTINLETSTLTPGVYLIQIESSEGNGVVRWIKK